MPDEDDGTLRPFRLAGGNQIRVLGPLETSILDALWDLTAASPTLFVSIEQVRVHLDLTAHYKTVQTVMNRLMEKGVLVRTATQRAYGYRAALTRAEWEAQTTRSIITELLAQYGDRAIAQFVATVRDVDPAQLAMLQRLSNAEEEAQ